MPIKLSIPARAPKIKEFYSSGSWKVPEGVTSIIVFAIAGGGGGGGAGGNQSRGGNGGQTIISGNISGVLLTLNGGIGGEVSTPNIAGNAGLSYSGVAGPGHADNSIGALRYNFGSGSPFGGGGSATIGAQGQGNNANGYGSGGSGAASSDAYNIRAAGGGSGQCALGVVLPVVPGETLSITVGANGSPGNGNSRGGSGAPGFVRIIYF